MSMANYDDMVTRDDVDFELREIDERILDMLEEGRCTRQHLASTLQVSGDYIYQRVDLMHKLGIISIIHDGFYELADDAVEDEVVTEDDVPTRVRDDTHEPMVGEQEQTVPVEHEATSADVAAVVERVSDSWTDTDERLAARRAAARAVLQHAVDSGEPVGKTEALEQFRDDHPVEGQADETWWRKNIRPVLSEVGTYSNGSHGYVVESLDEN